MNSLTRLLPYLWPHRSKILLSTFFAVLVAIFWSVNLSVAFPVVKVLLQGETLTAYVEKEVATAENEILKRSFRLKQSQEELRKMEAGEIPSIPTGKWSCCGINRTSRLNFPRRRTRN